MIRLVALHVVPYFGMPERRQDGEFGQVKVDFQQEIDQPQDVVFRLVVHPQQDGGFHADAKIVVTLDPVADVIRIVDHGLVNIPCPCLCGQVKDFRVVVDGMAAPVLLERDHHPEQLFLPFLILRQGIIHHEEPVVFDGIQFLGHFIKRPGPELPPAQE